MTDMFKPATDVLTNGVSTVMATLEKTKADVTINVQKTMKTAEELLAFGQGNIEAFTASGQILAVGAQELGKSLVQQAKVQADETVAAFKSFAAVKSVQDLLDLQTEFARSLFAKSAAETGRLSAATRKLADEALAPVNARVALAAETFSRAA
jgi:phasin family protein